MSLLSQKSGRVFFLACFLASCVVVGLTTERLSAQTKAKTTKTKAKASEKPASKEENEPESTSEAAKSDEKSIAQTKSGPYELKIDRMRFHPETAHNPFALNGLPAAKPMQKYATSSEEHKTNETFGDGQAGGMVSGYSAGGGSGGGGGWGGSYTVPNLILDLGLQGPKTSGKMRWLCAVAGNVKATDDKGRALTGPDTAPGMKFEFQNTEYRNEPGRTALHLSLPPEVLKDAKYLENLSGDLLVAEGTVNRFSFAGDDLTKSTTKKAEGVSAQLEKVQSPPEGVEIQLAVTLPPVKIPSIQERIKDINNPQAAMNLGNGTQIAVTMIDSEGKTHSATAKGKYAEGGNERKNWNNKTSRTLPGGGKITESGGGSSSSGSSGGSFGMMTGPGGSNPQSWSSNTNNDPNSPYETIKFGKLPEGVTVKSVSVTVSKCVGEPKTISFQFEHIPLDSIEK
jgi:hypothetical protein